MMKTITEYEVKKVNVGTDLSKQIKVTDIVSSYPEKSKLNTATPVGTIAQGGVVNNTITKQLSNASFLQGKFFKSFSKVDFDKLKTEKKKDGDETWSYTKKIDKTNHHLIIEKSNVLSSITLTEVKSQSEIDTIAKKYDIDKDETYITVDGKKYFVNMNIPIHFGTGSSTNVIMDMAIFVFGSQGLSAAIAGVAAKFGVDAFSAVLANINTQLFRVLWSAISGVMQLSYVFLQTFVGGIIGGEGVAAAFAAGQVAVGEAVAEGVFSAITATALAYTVVGIVVIATIYLILTYVLHYSYQNVYVYNLTKYDLDFEFSYTYEGNPHNVESKHLPAREKKTGPNNIDLGNWYSATGFRFQSDSQFFGIGYAMSLILKKPGTQTVYKKLACMFDIPFAGKNSLRATATYPSNMKSFYTKNEGKIVKTQNSDSNGDIELVVTYDYLSGKHLDPETDAKDYIYNSLVIVREKNTDFSLEPAARLKNNGYLSVASNAAYNFGKGDFTLQGWIKPSGPGTIIGRKSTAGGNDAYAGLLMVLEPNGAIKLATDNGFGYYQIMTNSTNAFDGDWHQVTAVRHNGALSIYLDGSLLKGKISGNLSTPLNVNNSLDLLIGSVQQNQEPHIHFSGGISQVRLWNLALQESQIKKELKTVLSGHEKGLVGYWPLNTNGNDMSVNHNNAVVQGDVKFTKA